MSPTRKGMDTAKVSTIADRLAQAERDLTAAASAADVAVRGLRPSWQGGDAKAFYDGWPALKDSLDAGALEVARLEKRLRQEVEDQDVASTAGGPGGGSGDDPADGDDDGTPDAQDEDDDNDGTPDEDEPPKLPDAPDGLPDPDEDDDGVPDDEDSDDDGDGVKDGDEDPLDDDGDGTPDTEDADDDGDGTPDEDDPEHRDDDAFWEESGFDSPEVDVGATFLEGEKELWDARAAGHTWGDEDGNHLSVEALSTEGSLDGQLGVTRDGFVAAGALSTAAYLAKVEGRYSTSYGTTAQGKAYVGAEANADAGVSLGRDGLKGGLGGEAFVGGKAEGSVNQSVGPVDVGVGGEVSYGLGAHLDANAEVSADHVGVDFDIGATLGIGGGVKLDVGFDPTFWN